MSTRRRCVGDLQLNQRIMPLGAATREYRVVFLELHHEERMMQVKAVSDIGTVWEQWYTNLGSTVLTVEGA